MAQFAEPKAILAMTAPDTRLAYPTAMRHYARSIAYARLRDRAGFDRELAALARLRMSDAMKGMIDQGVPAADLAMLAELVARGRFASAERRYDDAIGFYPQALATGRKTPLQEPAHWHCPI